MAQEREKLQLTKEEAQAIVWEDTSDYEIISDEVVDTRRYWVIDLLLVIMVMNYLLF